MSKFFVSLENLSAMTRLSFIVNLCRKISFFCFHFIVVYIADSFTMKNNGTNSSDLQTMMNFNEDSVPEDKHVWFHTLKRLSLSVLICLIILPSVFILIGLIYKDSCLAKPDLPIFLIAFGLLILINLFIYTLIGTTFLACNLLY